MMFYNELHLLYNKCYMDVIVVRSVEGGAVELPCDIASSNNDSVYLVLWYRKESGTPIYRYAPATMTVFTSSSGTGRSQGLPSTGTLQQQ